MKTIKVIDLLNKIANEEEVPKKIFYNNKTFEYDELESVYTYHNEDYSINEDLSIYIDGYSYNALNEEVEIIEEEKEIEIVDNGLTNEFYYSKDTNHNNLVDVVMYHKLVLEELVKAVNELKKGK